MFFHLANVAAVLSSALLVAAGDEYKKDCPTKHLVQVGLDVNGQTALRYNPPEVTAEIGDIILFQFFPKNHTAVRSSFEQPCVALKTPEGDNVFDTQFVPVSPDLVGNPDTFRELIVTTKEPEVIYCKQRVGNHCGSGMVMVINPSSAINAKTVTDRAIAINGTSGSGAPQKRSYAPRAGAVELTQLEEV